MDKVESIIFYHIAFFLILLFLWHGRKNRKYEWIGIFLLLLLSVCRYDIGNDYDNYYYIIRDSSRYFSNHDGFFSAFFRNSFKWSVEPLFAFLTYLFRNVEYNFIYIIGIYSVITIFFWYRTLKEINGVFWGIFFIITMGYLFISYDQIRQVAAISVFLFSIKYIEIDNKKKYLIAILCASLLHYSVLLIAIVYVFARVRPRIKLYCLIILVFYIGFLLNYWVSFRVLLFSHVPFYHDLAESERQLASGTFNTGFGLLFKIIVYLFLMVKLQKKKAIYSNMLFLGIVLLLFSSGNLSINRISNYFCFVSVLAFPIYYQFSIIQGRKIILTLLIALMMVNFEWVLNRGSVNGCLPYDSVLGDDIAKSRFRVREYRNFR